MAAKEEMFNNFSDIHSFYEEGGTLLPDPSVLAIVKATLGDGDTSVPKERVLETIASLSRQENFRTAFTECKLLELLVPCLLSADLGTQLQAVRVVGNLCYENDEGRETVLLVGGCVHIVKLMGIWSEKDVPERYLFTICGCALNIMADNEKLSKELSSHGVEKSLVDILKATSSEGTIEMALKVMYTLADQNASSANVLLQCGADQCLDGLIKQVSSKEDIQYAEALLEFLQTATNQDEWAVVVTERDWLSILLDLQDPDLAKKGADIIVLALSSDSCVKRIIDEGKVLQVAKKWMEDSSKLYLKGTGALFVANMARSDEVCCSLVKAGILEPLKNLLALEPSQEGAASVCQSSLSALRNLAIPVENKQRLFEAGIADDAIRHLESKSPSIQFKALGTLRLMTEKQEVVCDHLLSHKDLVPRVCELCSLGSHLEMEGCRLLASLVKYGKSQGGLARIVLETDGSKWLVNLLNTGKGVMVNEGLLSLAIIASKCDPILNERLASTDIVPSVVRVLEDAATSPEILSNALALFVHLGHDDKFSSPIAECGTFVSKALPTLKSHSMQSVAERAGQLAGLLESKVKVQQD